MHPFRHLATICRHRHLVYRHCCRAGIPWQGLVHDLSKFSPIEFWRGASYWQGTHSPTEEERRDIGYSLAWMHHKGRNRHHFEFWTDINPASGCYEPVPMPLQYVAEMFCDRMAASKTYLGKDYTNDAPYNYFVTKNARRLMHPDTAALLLSWLTVLKDEGETAAFQMVKLAVKEAKRAKRKRKKAR
jgi:hypothetical protein